MGGGEETLEKIKQKRKQESEGGSREWKEGEEGIMHRVKETRRKGERVVRLEICTGIKHEREKRGCGV